MDDFKVYFPSLYPGDLFDCEGDLYVKTYEVGNPWHMTNAFCLYSDRISQMNETVHISSEARVLPFSSVRDWNRYCEAKEQGLIKDPFVKED